MDQLTEQEQLSHARQRLHLAIERQKIACDTMDLHQLAMLGDVILMAANEIQFISKQIEQQEAQHV